MMDGFDAALRAAYESGMKNTTPPHAAPGKILSPAAKRALEEAAQRRENESASERPSETNGPKGAEPTRYGDWERGGIVYDF